MIQAGVGLEGFRLDGGDVRQGVIILQNGSAHGDTFVANIGSSRIVDRAGNQYLNGVLRFAAERAMQGF